jgi:hypothetical protein
MKVVFEFLGGPRDGQRLTGVVEDPAMSEAVCLYGHTSRARRGARFWCTCEYSVTALRTIAWTEIEQLESAGYRFRGHVYEVVERHDCDDSIIARARYLFPSE